MSMASTIVLCLATFALGSAAGPMFIDQTASAQVRPAETENERFQLSAYAAITSGNTVHHGSYVIDSATGEVWHVSAGAKPEPVGKVP